MTGPWHGGKQCAMLIRDMTSVDSRQERWTRRNYIPTNICRGRYRGRRHQPLFGVCVIIRLMLMRVTRPDVTSLAMFCCWGSSKRSWEYLNTALSSLLETFMVDINTFSTEKKRFAVKYFIAIRAYFCCKNRHTFAAISVRNSTGLRLYTWRQ